MMVQRQTWILDIMRRFIDESLDKNSNVTTGKVYWSVLQKERHGDFGGGTVQVIPHITNEIKRPLLQSKITGRRKNRDYRGRWNSW